MSRKAKNTNILYSNGKKIIFVELPYGYFYKGKYYTVAGCFKALLNDGEVETHKYDGGTWKYNSTIYHSLKELYEWNEDEIAMPFETFRRKYSEYGVYHNPVPRTLYLYDKDDERELFDSKEQVINELSFFASDFNFLADTEKYEEFYLETIPEEEVIKYLKKPIKNRIEILNQWKGN